MKLRQKTLLLIGLTLAGLIGVLYASLSTIFESSFAELEERNAHQNMRRVQEALSDEIATLNVTTADYAKWDDTYAFIQNANPDYVRGNLLNENFVRLQLNFFLLFDTNSKPVFSKGFNLEQKQGIPIPKSLESHLSANSVLLKHPHTGSSIAGILLLPESILMVASNPVLTSQGNGPSRGSLMMASYLNTKRIEQLAQRTQLSLRMYRFDDAQMPSDFQAARSALEKMETKTALNAQKAPIFIRPLSADVIASYTLVQDIYDKPALLLRADMPREIYKQGQVSLHYLILSLFGVGLVFTIGTLWLLEKTVLSRLTHLSSNVERIGASSDLSLRVFVTGNDELTTLGNTINSTLGALESASQKLVEEREKAERLLLNILPASIAKRLEQEQNTIADSFDEATVLFADIVNFTNLSSEISPTELVCLLNEIFSRFDRLVERYNLEKIKTIGDSYMVVGGLPLPYKNHAESIAEFALDMQQEIEIFNAEKGQEFSMRIGINSGPVVAGVIGIKKFIYDLWGDTVNIASRMESHGVPGCIQVSSTTYERLKDKYIFQERGIIYVKGKGEMTTYLLNGRKSNNLVMSK